jgi:thiosulfate/3-mercaptopyruvate sulfurtransferase
MSTDTAERPASDTIDGDALAALAADPAPAERTIVDVRPLTYYNGWRFGDEPRGGHIPGAVSFPVDWLEAVDRVEVARLLAGKRITPDREVIVYGRADDDAARAAAALAEHGVPSRTLAGGFASWVGGAARPVERLVKYDRLVDIAWLAQLHSGGRPEAAPVGPLLLFHVNFAVPEEYAEGHLPGALYLDTNWLEDPDNIWQRRTPAELDDAVRALGITTDTTVVVYGRDTVGEANEKWPGRRAGQIAATRALMILRYAGVKDVRLLDGGYDWWVRAGHPVETALREPTPVAAFGAPIPQHPEIIVDIDEAKQILADRAGAALVSVRTWKEHIGRVSGYNYIGPAGRIAGDVWGNCGSDAYHMQHYRNLDNTMRAYPEIAANWEAAGITPDKWVAFYCGTGWRASETWFYADLQGWQRIAVYDGGWYEWSADPANNPIDIGDPEAVSPDDEYAA